MIAKAKYRRSTGFVKLHPKMIASQSHTPLIVFFGCCSVWYHMIVTSAALFNYSSLIRSRMN